MEIKVLRTRFLPTRTVGQLYINGEYFCFTQEDKVREVQGQSVEKWKVHGETAIPYGRYRILLEVSKRFGPDTPTLKSVPGFDYIRIHSGNTELDTLGCLLLGYSLNDDGTIKGGTSRPAVNEFKRKLKEVIDKEEVWISIQAHPTQ